MKYLLFKIIPLTCLLFLASCGFSDAALITIESPAKTSPNRTPVLVRVMLDPEKNTVSGISGNFSFPTDMFTVKDISAESSAVSLWIKQPKVSDEKYVDGRTHIIFEGIFPGGFDGVRSPYYKGVRPGVIFSLVLIPKYKGVGELIVDDILLHKYDSEATKIPTTNVSAFIENPTFSAVLANSQTTLREIESPTLTAFIGQDALIDNNAWYLMVNEREQKSSIDRIYVAENDQYHAYLVDEYDWRVVKVPYVLTYQNRTKYVHVKIVYSDNSYTFRTIAPVENSKSIPFASRILLGVALALSVLYVYANYFFNLRKKQKNNEL